MEKISMRKIKEVFRLRFEQNLSNAKIAGSLNIGETTVEQYVFRAKRAGLTWPLLNDISDEALEQLLYPPKKGVLTDRVMPDFFFIHKELKKKGVTLTLLWIEYKNIYRSGYELSRFCGLYHEWCSNTELWMPQEHKAGEASYIDYSGLTIPIYEQNGECFDAQIFVSTLGASSYTYIEATRTQQIKDWISSHKRMFTFYEGIPGLLIPDNLKSGVTKPDRYEPDLNPTYYEMAQHYGTTILPARVRRPQDKSKVENGVLNVERKILAPLRNQKFFSCIELNRVLWERLEILNKTPFQKLPGSSRYSLYLELEKPALKPLPDTPYELSYWKKDTVNPGYHVKVEDVSYSVPYTFIRKPVEIRYNERVVEVFCKGKQIAIHPISHEKSKHITNHNHRPPSHQHQADCTAENIQQLANNIGENTARWVEQVLIDDSLHIRKREKTCLGVVRLTKTYPPHRLEAACQRGLYYRNFLYKGVKAILENNLDQIPLPKEGTKKLPQEHENIRGAEYFEQTKGVQE